MQGQHLICVFCGTSRPSKLTNCPNIYCGKQRAVENADIRAMMFGQKPRGIYTGGSRAKSNITSN